MAPLFGFCTLATLISVTLARPPARPQEPSADRPLARAAMASDLRVLSGISELGVVVGHTPTGSPEADALRSLAALDRFGRILAPVRVFAGRPGAPFLYVECSTSAAARSMSYLISLEVRAPATVTTTPLVLVQDATIWRMRVVGSAEPRSVAERHMRADLSYAIDFFARRLARSRSSGGNPPPGPDLSLPSGGGGGPRHGPPYGTVEPGPDAAGYGFGGLQ